MECRYCQALNAEDDHRCRRCGRRLRMTPLYTSRSAAALALRYEHSDPTPAKDVSNRAQVATEAPPAPSPRRPITYQPSLFASREVPRVVPFATLAPESIQRQPKREISTEPRIRRPKVVPGQQNLEFAPAPPARRPSEGVIYCDAPVAIPAHRAMAAVLDASVILIGLGIFGLIFHTLAGEIVLSAKSLPLVLAIAGVVAGVYKLLWCLGDGDSAGMRWSRLTLVNFDGKVPGRKQRFYRMGFGFLSLMAAGLGLLWSLVDEETLTWHDHISKTFPTPY
jgi:hypothetical protein